MFQLIFSTLFRAMVFGFCGVLGFLTFTSFEQSLWSVYGLIFLSYGAIFWSIALLDARRKQRETPFEADASPPFDRDSVLLWRVWLWFTLVWLVSYGALIIYPSFVSGLYLMPDEQTIAIRSFPAMPAYIHWFDASALSVVFIFTTCFLYYPVTFYRLITMVIEWHQSSSARRIWRITLLGGVALLPILLWQATRNMLLWLID